VVIGAVLFAAGVLKSTLNLIYEKSKKKRVCPGGKKSGLKARTKAGPRQYRAAFSKIHQRIILRIGQG
jgi:hypothetical protein